MDPLDCQYHSVEETDQALRALPLAFLDRLRRWVTWKLTGNSRSDADDVIGDVWLRFSVGSRRWSKGVGFPTCFWSAVRSAVSGEWDKHKRVAAKQHLPVTAEGEAADALEDVAGEVPSPLDELITEPERQRQQKILDHIFDSLSNDQAVMAVLSGIEAGMSPKQVQDAFGISETQYDSARRKLRRFLSKHYPNGWQSHG